MEERVPPIALRAGLVIAGSFQLWECVPLEMLSSWEEETDSSLIQI
jgi:hypothetical protein